MLQLIFFSLLDGFTGKLNSDVPVVAQQVDADIPIPFFFLRSILVTTGHQLEACIKTQMAQTH